MCDAWPKVVSVTLVLLAVASVSMSVGVVVNRELQKRERLSRCNAAGGYWDEGKRLCGYPPLFDCPVLRADGGPVGLRLDGGWCEVALDELPELAE